MMRQGYFRFSRLKSGIRKAFVDVFQSPYGRPAKKALITVAGVVVILLGIALIVLPGPAVVLIPLGLAILAIEYPGARKWLRKFQHGISVAARKADDFLASRKAKL